MNRWNNISTINLILRIDVVIYVIAPQKLKNSYGITYATAEWIVSGFSVSIVLVHMSSISIVLKFDLP